MSRLEGLVALYCLIVRNRSEPGSSTKRTFVATIDSDAFLFQQSAKVLAESWTLGLALATFPVSLATGTKANFVERRQNMAAPCTFPAWFLLEGPRRDRHDNLRSGSKLMKPIPGNSIQDELSRALHEALKRV